MGKKECLTQKTTPATYGQICDDGLCPIVVRWAIKTESFPSFELNPLKAQV
jgi:hypothetical protein